MRFFDTLTRSVREFEPLTPGRVTMYTCGPTVYRFAHIGNMRTYITADLLRRALEFDGYEVVQVTNITDVGHMTDDSQESGGEDKILLAAGDEGLTPQQIAAKYTDTFMRDLEALNIQKSSLFPKATDHIGEMIDVIKRLTDKGLAYEKEGFVYFDVGNFPGYGKLSKQTGETLETGHRIEEVDPRKRDPRDFTLWRASGARRLMSWDSPWGTGFPGWHIECTAMSVKYLGERFDIHTGGEDNVFPHHECEIAQSEGALGHEVVRYWLHGAHLLAEGKKMSKSAGNVFLVGDIIERGFDPLAFRYLMMQARYRAQMNFTWDGLGAAQRGLEHLRKQMAEWAGEPLANPTEAATDLDKRFREAVSADLDMPKALTVVSEVVGSQISAAERYSLLLGWDAVLGLDLGREAIRARELPHGAKEMITKREQARSAKDWSRADQLRKDLLEMGVELIDTAEGTRWLIKD